MKAFFKLLKKGIEEIMRERLTNKEYRLIIEGFLKFNFSEILTDSSFKEKPGLAILRDKGFFEKDKSSNNYILSKEGRRKMWLIRKKLIQCLMLREL